METETTPTLIRLIWVILSAAIVISLFSSHWPNVFVSATALLLTFLPTLFAKRYQITFPPSFLVAISFFVFATLFLGEVAGFYERLWWWDIFLHASSAVGFGIIGFLFAFFLFEGDKYAAPPWALGMIAFSFAVSIGAVWEIFEFAMDQIFDLNMQKSGLVDTMWDLIVDCGGALFGASAGFFWLKGREATLTALVDEFVNKNRTLFRRMRRRQPRGK